MLEKAKENSDHFFSDGIRRIDFVLVYEDDSDIILEEEKESQRQIFYSNLEKEGIEIELDSIGDISLKFVKLHAPFEVLTRYAEILKLRLPMKQKVDEAFLRKQLLLRIPGITTIELTAPAAIKHMTDYIGEYLSFVKNDPEIFPPRNRHYTAIYSRSKEYLFDIHEDFFTNSVRSRIVDFILKRKRFSDDENDVNEVGIEKMVSDSIFISAYPIHEGELRDGNDTRARLYNHWACLSNFYKYQPLDHIKDYFGVKVGLYFAWLGFYTTMLIPASLVGLLCFIYALATINQHQPSNDICNYRLNITMCPLCDTFCDYWNLEETCFHARLSYLVDNPATIFFACFMSFWAALFLEMWKRYSAEITHRWDLTSLDVREEHPRPQYLARLAHVKNKTINIITGQYEPKPPFWRMRLPGSMISLSSVLLLAAMALSAVVGVILYRMSILTALSLNSNDILTSNAMLFTSITAACINLFCIMIFNQIYSRIAEFLTELELKRTQTEFDDSLSLKIYLLQFINYYASIFYIAFIKSKFVGFPGNYHRIFGSRQEECSPGGCLLELSVQLAIIMVGKQAVNAVKEMIIPLMWRYIKFFSVLRAQVTAADGDNQSNWPRWAKDFRLVNFDPRGLFDEYLEMILQYGFVTIFVASFPLAPLFAFVNNVLETRLDAKKLLTHYRRPVSQRVKDIGIWFKILDSIGKLAVITNAFIIAFTSNFIPQLVYKIIKSENHDLEGFLDYSLSVFNISDYPKEYVPRFHTSSETCRYPDYRNPPGHEREYKFAPIFWHILAARLAFVVVFENIVGLIMMLIKWMIPDIPHSLMEKMRRETYVTSELIVTNELIRARGLDKDGDDGHHPSSFPRRSPLKRNFSEPTRDEINHGLRFRTMPPVEDPEELTDPDNLPFERNNSNASTRNEKMSLVDMSEKED